MTSWPRRDAICLDCRTLQPAATACLASDRHHLVGLRTAAGRDALLTRVWGSPSMRARLRTAAKVGGTGGAGGLLDACGGCDGCGVIDGAGSLGEVLAAIALVALVFVAGYALLVGLRALWRWWRGPARVQPRGAVGSGLGLGPASGRIGLVVAPASAPAAIGDEPCAGYALEARVRTRWREHRVLLRDGATVGFDVVLDDGAVVTIPPGPIVVDHPDAAARAVRPTFTAYLDDVDPLRRTADDLEPFAATHVRQAVVRAGDRVELRGPLRALPDGGARGPAYRAAPSERLTPIGVPRVRVIA